VQLHNNTHMTFMTQILLTHFLKLIQYFQKSSFQHNCSVGLSLPVFPAPVCVSITCLYNISLVYSYHFTDWKEHLLLLFLLLFPPPLILLPLYFMQRVILPVYASKIWLFVALNWPILSLGYYRTHFMSFIFHPFSVPFLLKEDTCNSVLMKSI